MDQDLFAEIYEAHARAVYAHAVRMTSDRAGAEDIVSLTFLEAWRLRETFDGVTSHRAWLLGVATNVVRNTRRAARRHRVAMNRLPGPEAVPDPADAVVSRIADTARAAAALAALDRLRRADREVIVLSVWGGLSHAEVAEACGTGEATVRSRLSRARSRLRRLTTAVLSEESGTEPGTGSPGGPAARGAVQNAAGRVSASRTGREGNL